MTSKAKDFNKTTADLSKEWILQIKDHISSAYRILKFFLMKNCLKRKIKH